MDKTHKIITSLLVIALLFLSLPFMMTRATSETGFDYINKGDRYEFKRITESSETVRKNLDISGHTRQILGGSLTDDRGKRHMARTDDLCCS